MSMSTSIYMAHRTVSDALGAPSTAETDAS